MLEHLDITENKKIEFLDLAAECRGEIPADIATLIKEHPKELDKIRTTLSALLSVKE